MTHRLIRSGNSSPEAHDAMIMPSQIGDSVSAYRTSSRRSQSSPLRRSSYAGQ